MNFSKQKTENNGDWAFDMNFNILNIFDLINDEICP